MDQIGHRSLNHPIHDPCSILLWPEAKENPRRRGSIEKRLHLLMVPIPVLLLSMHFPSFNLFLLNYFQELLPNRSSTPRELYIFAFLGVYSPVIYGVCCVNAAACKSSDEKRSKRPRAAEDEERECRRRDKREKRKEKKSHKHSKRHSGKLERAICRSMHVTAHVWYYLFIL